MFVGLVFFYLVCDCLCFYCLFFFFFVGRVCVVFVAVLCWVGCF